MQLHDYVGALAAANEQAQVRGDELENELDSRLRDASDQEAIAAYKEFFDASASAADGLIEDVQGIEPPPEVQEAHEALASALEDLRAAYVYLIVQLDEISNRAEAEELIGATVAPAAKAGREACLEILAFADANGIAVALECDS